LVVSAAPDRLVALGDADGEHRDQNHRLQAVVDRLDASELAHTQRLVEFTDDEFEAALERATAGGDLSRENVLRCLWASRIHASEARTVENIIATGGMVLAAKEALAHGEFERMVRENLRWSPQHARRYMAIARHPLLRDRARVCDLPPAVGALAELAKVKPEAIEAAISKGIVRPDMTRRDVTELIYSRARREREAAERHAQSVHALAAGPEPPPSPRDVLRAIAEDAGSMIQTMMDLQERIAAAITSGAHGEIRASVPYGEPCTAAELLDQLDTAIERALHTFSSDDYDDLATIVGLPRLEQEP
jgi:hypothetical protein